MTAYRDYKIIANNKIIGIVNLSWDSVHNYRANVLLNGPACMELINNDKKNKNKNIQLPNINAETRDDLFNKIDNHLKAIIPDVKYEINIPDI